MLRQQTDRSPQRRGRATVLALVLALALAVAPAASAGQGSPPDHAGEAGRPGHAGQSGPPGHAAAVDDSWEVWALDQGPGLDRLHVYDSDLEEVASVDLGEHGLTTPHMVEFDSRNRYAVVAATGTGSVGIVRTSDYEVIEVIETGAVAHMAHFTPDDSSIWVANIGAGTFTEIEADLATEEFSLGRELDVATDPAYVGSDLEDVGATPVCHEYTADGAFAYLTLGPGPGGLVVVDITADDPFIEHAFSRDDVKANCGLALSHDGAKMYANAGDPGTPVDPDDPSAGVVEEETGEWYVLDTDDHSLVASSADTRGVDPHGVRITPDGQELWQVNRGSANGIVIDPGTHEIVDEIDDTGGTPDILDFSPDGQLAFVSLRGPNPVSGAAHVAFGDDPGFAVLDVASREVTDVIQPAGEDELDDSDFHGIAVRGPRFAPGPPDHAAGQGGR